MAIKAIMNNRVGLMTVAKTKDAIKILTLCLNSKALEDGLKGDVLSILTVLCMTEDDPANGVSNCHGTVLSSFNSFREHYREKRRFQSLVNALRSATTNISLKAKYLALINALINEAPDIDLRVSIRNEFLSLGVQEALNEFKSNEQCRASQQLMTQIDVFGALQDLDVEELGNRFDPVVAELKVNVDTLDGAVTALKELGHRAGLDAVVVSSRPRNCFSEIGSCVKSLFMVSLHCKQKARKALQPQLELQLAILSLI